DVIVADYNGRLLRVTPGGSVSVIASSGLGTPGGVAIDSGGDFIVGDFKGGRLLRVTPGGSVSVIASSGLGNLHDVAIDSIGDQTGELHRITPGGSVSVIASSGLGNPAGVQTNLAWIVPVVLSVSGLGIFLVKKKF
ncbi:MAG: hypothetical protein IH784_08525, partial [Bacteroidetes bacterium]|nr:hypothetical protein [Bacteroidota bacterium]